MMKNSIDRGPNPSIDYFQTESENVIICMGKNLFLNSIKRVSTLFLYMKNVVML